MEIEKNKLERKLVLWRGLTYLAIAGGILFGSYQYSQGIKKGKIEVLIEQEFNSRYTPKEGIISDPIASKIYEMKNAFVEGEIEDNPYYNSKNELERLAKEGKNLKDSLDIKL